MSRCGARGASSDLLRGEKRRFEGGEGECTSGGGGEAFALPVVTLLRLGQSLSEVF